MYSRFAHSLNNEWSSHFLMQVDENLHFCCLQNDWYTPVLPVLVISTSSFWSLRSSWWNIDFSLLFALYYTPVLLEFINKKRWKHLLIFLLTFLTSEICLIIHLLKKVSGSFYATSFKINSKGYLNTSKLLTSFKFMYSIS